MQKAEVMKQASALKAAGMGQYFTVMSMRNAGVEKGMIAEISEELFGKTPKLTTEQQTMMAALRVVINSIGE